MDKLLMLSQGEELWLPVLSGSMAPVFIPGDQVLVQGLDPDTKKRALKAGVIAVFFNEGVFFFHRIIISVPAAGYVFQKGDSNSTGSWIRTGRIVGTVTARKRVTAEGVIEVHTDFNTGNVLFRLVINLLKTTLKSIRKRLS